MPTVQKKTHIERSTYDIDLSVLLPKFPERVANEIWFQEGAEMSLTEVSDRVHLVHSEVSYDENDTGMILIQIKHPDLKHMMLSMFWMERIACQFHDKIL